MNVFDLLKVAGILPAGWGFASGNYQAIVDLTARYGTPHAIDLLLFIGIIAWEGGCAGLLWWACQRFGRRHGRRWRTVNLGFVGLFVLFAGFILGDEIFQNFRMERDHRGIAVLLLASVLALQLLPDRIRET
jgi:4-amino-4-deoxy-L-arabinose transferase-like glycosyltransferase